jgi:protein SCO1/2
MNRLNQTATLTGVVMALLSLLATASCSAETQAAHADSDPHAAHRAAMEAPDKSHDMTSARVKLSEAPMLDQNNKARRLASDVVGDRIVVVDFIFTSCQTICPVTTSLLGEARKRLRDVPDSELVFVSMSIDSNTDTPERLAAFAARHRADWTFLTGEKATMDSALTDMDAYSTNPEDHAPMILIGDARSGHFVRVFGLPDPDFVESRVHDYLAMRGTCKDDTPGHDHAGDPAERNGGSQ